MNVRANEKNPLTSKLNDIRSFAKKLGVSLRKASNENVVMDTSKMGPEQTMKDDLTKFDKKLGLK
jgi:hypothetical protein